MAQISIEKIDPEVLRILINVADTVIDTFFNVRTFDVTCLPTEDVDMAEAWQDSLMLSQKGDYAQLRMFLEDERLGREEIPLEDECAEGILRGCTAARIKIREHFLKMVRDEELENGEVEFGRLTLEQRQYYACYTFLASIQESIIVALEG